MRFVCPYCGVSAGTFDEVKEHSWYCGKAPKEENQ